MQAIQDWVWRVTEPDSTHPHCLKTCRRLAGQQGQQAQGRTALRGAIAGRALVHKRDTWSMAAAALKVWHVSLLIHSVQTAQVLHNQVLRARVTVRQLYLCCDC